MDDKRTVARTHAVLVIDENKHILDERAKVSVPDLLPLLAKMRTLHGPAARILLDGADVEDRLPTRASRGEPVQVVTDRSPAGTAESIELAHAMLWDTYDRAARVQSWMLEQASAFTLDLLENNKRLADQAGELQKRYQTALAEIDYMQREQKMMEAEDAASRYSRHLIEKTKAEIAAAVPPRQSSDVIDDIIDGAAVALGLMCGQTAPRGTRGPKNTN